LFIHGLLPVKAEPHFKLFTSLLLLRASNKLA
jgi:hypothetical protein